MAQPVVEIRAVSRFRDQISGGFIDVAEAHAGLYDTLRLFVGLTHQIMDGGVFLRRFLTEKGARHVGAVAVLHAAHVDYHAVSCLQTGAVRLVVRIGRVGAEGKNAVEPFGTSGLFVERAHLIGAFLFRHAFLYKGRDFFHAGIIDPGGFPHFILLIIVLDGTHPVHAVGGVHIFCLRVFLHQAQQKAGGPAFVNAERSVRPVFRDVLRHHVDAVVRVGHPDFVQIHLGDHEQIVQEEAVLSIRAHVQRVQTLIGLHPHPGQIPDA